VYLLHVVGVKLERISSTYVSMCVFSAKILVKIVYCITADPERKEKQKLDLTIHIIFSLLTRTTKTLTVCMLYNCHLELAYYYGRTYHHKRRKKVFLTTHKITSKLPIDSHISQLYVVPFVFDRQVHILILEVRHVYEDAIRDMVQAHS